MSFKQVWGLIYFGPSINIKDRVFTFEQVVFRAIKMLEEVSVGNYCADGPCGDATVLKTFKIARDSTLRCYILRR